MPGDVVDIELLDQFDRVAASCDMLSESAFHGIHDLSATTVTDCDIDLETAAFNCVCGGLCKNPGGTVGEQVERPDHLNFPVAIRAGDVPYGRFDDFDQRPKFRGWAAEVVVGEHEERDVSDVGGGAPLQKLGYLGATNTVSLADIVVASLSCPATIAVEHDSDVPGSW